MRRSYDSLLSLAYCAAGCRHTGPVWQVAWAHPKFGSILASCSYDGKVIIWKEQQGQPGSNGWAKIKEHTLHIASGMSSFVPYFGVVGWYSNVLSEVNSVSWAPHELGAILACASSDGKISVLTFKSTFHPVPCLSCIVIPCVSR